MELWVAQERGAHDLKRGFKILRGLAICASMPCVSPDCHACTTGIFWDFLEGRRAGARGSPGIYLYQTVRCDTV